LAASNDRTPLPPASLTKVLTALVAVAALKPTDTVPISDRAAAMPAHKLNMKAGEVWPARDVLSSLLASSANDAAAALAERVSGSLEDFHLALEKLARHLQMADAPTLQDAAGLDDSFSVRGGNLISARDLAIAARAALAQPRLAAIVGRPITEFVGPDGVHHRLVNHNKMLTRYAGAIGMKTGFTRRAGRGLIAAATRNGRTEIVVVLNTPDTYGWAAQLLDAAFAHPVAMTGDRLPRIPAAMRLKAAPIAAASDDVTLGEPAPAQPDKAAAHHRGVSLLVQVPVTLLALLVVLWCMLRARVVARRRRRRQRASAQGRHPVHRRPRTYRHDEQTADRLHSTARQYAQPRLRADYSPWEIETSTPPVNSGP
jgi:D-alanyl-D-alanine carboxypeptidase (penicillin-binding protein 5/6)